MGKILEKNVLEQVNTFIKNNSIFDTFQSGFKAHHSTEIAFVKVMNNIEINTNKGLVLVLLDLSVAFDPVDNEILVHRLENLDGLSGMVLSWFRSYLMGSFLSPWVTTPQRKQT